MVGDYNNFYCFNTLKSSFIQSAKSPGCLADTIFPSTATRLEVPQTLEKNRAYTLHWQTRRIVEEEALAPLAPERVETAAFEERIDQVAFALKKVDEFIGAGADPDRVAVILPEEGFAEYLRLFDPFRNFNYAMGTPFTQSRYYRRLADLYDALTGRSESAREKMEGEEIAEAFAKVEGFDTFVAFLQALPTQPRELEAIDAAKAAGVGWAVLVEKNRPGLYDIIL